MKNFSHTIALILLLLLGTGLPRQAQAQDPITEVIKAGVTKVIVAMDLQIQRLQNETIWLQNAQKVLENRLTELRLTQIADWTERQRQLYASYFVELRQVKAILTAYGQVQDIIRQQTSLVDEYRRAYSLFRRDGNFSPEELAHMQQVYAGILAGSAENLDQVLLVLRVNALQLSDGERLVLLHQATEGIARHYSDLRAFNDENVRLSLQRARERNNLQAIRQLYGID